jgi:hypothetical protein
MESDWKKLNGASYFFVKTCEEHTDYTANTGVNKNRLMRSSLRKRGVIRALSATSIKLSRIREIETNVEYLTHFDIDEVRNLIDLLLLKSLKSVVAMLNYFQKLRPM